MHKKNIRFVYMIVLGVIVSFLLDFIVKANIPGRNKFLDILSSVIITIIVWEGNLRIDHWMNTNFSWVTKPLRRILVHLPVSMLYSAIVIYVSMLGFNKYVCNGQIAAKNTFMSTAVVIGVMVSIIILSVEVGIQFFRNWKNSLLEIEKHKTESIQAQLQNLKNQINPHFLFNNMSVLSSLVYQDQDKAVDFINQLSKVYRFLLDTKSTELVTLEEELKFMKSYTYLLQIRFDKSIHFHYNIKDEDLIKYLPPMTLQILVENAIKHNEASLEHPLCIDILTNGAVLEVVNTIRLREVYEESSKTGLQNIKDRYQFFTSVPVIINSRDSKFSVIIPLIKEYEGYNH